MLTILRAVVDLRNPASGNHLLEGGVHQDGLWLVPDCVQHTLVVVRRILNQLTKLTLDAFQRMRTMAWVALAKQIMIVP